ncbi:MAG: CooT family nickel-binding protein [Nitrospira sp.]|nr:CooT family nickel-binding protein [Nitrospira sp.]
MACDEMYYRHFHKKQNHTHQHQHEAHHTHPHGQKGSMDQKKESHPHHHEEVLHTHPYQHDDPHHQPEALLLGVTVYALENRKEQLILDDVDLMEFDDDQIVIHNILGSEKKLTAKVKRVHFVDRGKVIMLLEK